MPSARFDDLTPGTEHAYRFADPVDEVVAWTPDGVAAALDEVGKVVDAGGWAAGYVAYEAAAGLDPALAVHDPAPGRPLARFGIYRERGAVEPVDGGGDGRYAVSAWEPAMDRGAFVAAVTEVQRAIAAGDTYQVNLTFPLRARFEGDPSRWYADLASAQRGGFNAHLDFGDEQVLSASPELFFDVRGADISTRPMKGTVRRGRWSAEDVELARRLAASEKDRAENVMIVDLLRNDLGRIAGVGSVRVERPFTVERYETVWQLTSTVSARLARGVGLTGVFRALFPCGSVTGAPKVSTMGIIRRLEDRARGVYCGAVGFAGPGADGGMRAVFSVPIRTVHLDPADGAASYGVGCGITWGSDADAEYEEARWKARLLGGRRPDFELVETLAWHPGTGFQRGDRHLARLTASAGYFGFAVDPATVGAALDDAVAGKSLPQRVRLAVDRAGRPEVTTADLDDGRFTDPVRFAVAALPLPPDDVVLFHKTTARHHLDGPRRAHRDVDDVLLVNERGELTEFTVANVALLLDGEWCTPPLESGLLPGVLRAELLEEGAVTERVLTVADLDRAEEVAWFNSARGRRRAVRGV